jgi:hypothetical protein
LAYRNREPYRRRNKKNRDGKEEQFSFLGGENGKDFFE